MSCPRAGAVETVSTKGLRPQAGRGSVEACVDDAEMVCLRDSRDGRLQLSISARRLPPLARRPTISSEPWKDGATRHSGCFPSSYLASKALSRRTTFGSTYGKRSKRHMTRHRRMNHSSDESICTSDWCCEQPRAKSAADDLLTCVAVSFYEHIPLHPKARDDMPRWWRAEDLASGPEGEPSIFAYHLTGNKLEELKRFLERERDRYDPALW